MGMLFGNPATAPINLRDLYFNEPAPPVGMSAPKPTLADKVAGFVSSRLRGAGVSQRTAQRFGDKITAAADALTPFGAATSAQQAGRDYRAGHYGAAAANAVGALLNAIPDGGALTAKGAGVLHSIIAPLFHGSPHKFEKFALEKIGTGEGAQSYGHGLYFAENPAVAQQYQAQLANQFSRVREPDGSWTVEEIAGRAAPIRGLSDEQSARLVRKEGYVYKVSLNANPEDFLNYDAPIADQPAAMDALRNLDLSKTGAMSRTRRILEFARDGQELPEYRTTGRELLNAVSNYGENRAAEHGLLMPYGIKGVSYFDQGSRGAGTGTRNYVVYDPNIIDILARN